MWPDIAFTLQYQAESWKIIALACTPLETSVSFHRYLSPLSVSPRKNTNIFSLDPVTKGTTSALFQFSLDSTDRNIPNEVEESRESDYADSGGRGM